MADTQLVVRRVSPWTTLRISAAVSVVARRGAARTSSGRVWMVGTRIARAPAA